VAVSKIRLKKQSDFLTDSRYIIVCASRNSNSTNVYLQFNGTAMNTVPFVMPYSAQLVAMSAATNGNETWVAEVRVNGSLVTGATLSLSGVSSNYSTSYTSINFSAGDLVQLYCNGTTINMPRINAIFRRTD
jgi:hypothetical protein